MLSWIFVTGTRNTNSESEEKVTLVWSCLVWSIITHTTLLGEGKDTTARKTIKYFNEFWECPLRFEW